VPCRVWDALFKRSRRGLGTLWHTAAHRGTRRRMSVRPSAPAAPPPSDALLFRAPLTFDASALRVVRSVGDPYDDDSAEKAAGGTRRV
jgi:hypothetical protein